MFTGFITKGRLCVCVCVCARVPVRVLNLGLTSAEKTSHVLNRLR